MTNEQKTVLRKIIYAVETGGQVYGQQDSCQDRKTVHTGQLIRRLPDRYWESGGNI